MEPFECEDESSTRTSLKKKFIENNATSGMGKTVTTLEAMFEVLVSIDESLEDIVGSLKAIAEK